MYIKIKDGVPTSYSLDALRRDNPQVSFPSEINDNTLAEYDVFPCMPIPYPGTDYLHNIREGPATFVDGVWRQTWIITEASDEEIAQRTQNEAAAVRDLRDARLRETDWTQVADAPVNASVWSDYRQALRDVPAQAGFPWNVNWPTSP